ncbi:MAG: enamine deaminase RidA [Robiginitomaculum sp.]|nr:MAG: enamine deaminase RidA [Robiginitomaculum sp.]
MKQILLPDGWPKPKGYANGILCEGKMVFTAGVIGWNAQEKLESGDLIDQLRQTLKNTVAILAKADAKPSDIVRMTWYVTDMEIYRESLKEIGAVWREEIGKVFPCMACVAVTALVEPRAVIEIETTAVLSNANNT